MCNSSANHSSDDPSVEELYILKHIMVERGNNACLSGLREEYLGEIFLNASISIRGLASTCFSNNLNKAQDFYQLLQRNDSILFDLKKNWNSANARAYNFGFLISDYEEGSNHIARYVESFEPQQNEIWLALRNEGQSLLIYITKVTGGGAGSKKDQNLENIQMMHHHPLYGDGC
jgi:hypothetical protein